MRSFIENRSLVLAVLLLSAILLYAYGFQSGAFVFVVFGVVFEIAFWLGLLGSDDDDASSPPD